ncbi:MAG: C39 family peptidase [Methanomicrobiaceae archaeon]|nr:C39 family peptidase [Methanomicrobiaceae archaeon]
MKTKFGMRALSLLLVMALAGAVFVPAVSAIKDESIIEKNYVSVDDAYDHAFFALIEFYSAGILDDNEKWLGATLNTNPEIIYDINGQKLFYLFNVYKNGEKLGEIKIAASKVIGNSVITIGLQEEELDVEKLEKTVQEKAIQLSGESCSFSTKLVCYSYPKIGMMASYSDPKSGTENKIVIDSYDYSLVEEKDCFSYYEDIPSSIINKNIDSWINYDNLVREYYKSVPTITDARSLPLSEQIIKIMDKELIKSLTVSEYKTLSNFILHGQNHDNWCAVACAQMISEYHGVTRNQDDIADKMGITTEQGATTEQQLYYYQSPIASDGLGKSNSNDYDLLYWDDVKDEINNNRPFVVENNGHSRACSGYWRSGSTDLTYLYLNNPAYGGSQGWEWMNELNPDFYNENIRVKD